MARSRNTKSRSRACSWSWTSTAAATSTTSESKPSSAIDPINFSPCRLYSLRREQEDGSAASSYARP
eukprot:scaffold26628_cov33-Tisochrysis_lutea.AAC.1